MIFFFGWATVVSFFFLCIALISNIIVMQKNFKKIDEHFKNSEKLKYHMTYGRYGGIPGKLLIGGVLTSMLGRKSWYVKKKAVERDLIESFPQNIEISLKRTSWAMTLAGAGTLICGWILSLLRG